MKRVPQYRTRVLFFAWGDSIHARRRIGIFCEDDSFEVGVVSTFRYGFENASNYYLSGVLQADEKASRLLRLMTRCCFALPGSLLYLAMRFFGGASLAECSNFVRDIFLIRRYINDFRPDVVFLQTLMYPCFLSYFWLNKIPMIVTFWNGDVTWWAKWTGIERALKRKIVQHGARRAAAITVNSRAALNACLGYGATEEKVRLIRYPGVNLQMFKPHLNRAEVREQLGLPSESRIVFCPRGLGGYLNSDIIIEAAAQVIKRFPDTQFLFMVRDDVREVWDFHLKQARELGVVSNILGVGNVPWENMPLYYQAADVMVSISSNDSLPNCMLEAMACGVPVIMGDIPQISEWVTDGKNGYSTPPRDPFELASRIVRVFADQNGVVDEIVQHNIGLIHREVDSRIVAVAVKELVHGIANGTRV
ncbi:MAG: glycosyltransferase family 4 protein [Propionivibrio sp.]|uniref:Glycosyltransferase family 4 protein n=1 Tax=Candidatus Propionivibrio dominans TaxID=2954373 RepID=A0A9D7I692_9RHOO|nr:glycosyltransferase family 4 protein [Candidatus Propionivibrio dominans]